jgi:hypothetical protein
MTEELTYNKVPLFEGALLDYTIVYLVAKRLTLPIKEWEAFKLGIIDEEGKKIRDPKGSKERDAYTLLDKLILKLKHLIGNHKLRVFTAALLLREQNEEVILEDEMVEWFTNKKKMNDIFASLQSVLSEENISIDTFFKFLVTKGQHE